MIDSKIISILVPDDRIGGAESVLKKIAMYHLSQNDQVHVFFLKKPLANAWDDLKKDFQTCTLYYTKSKSEKRGILKISKNLIKLSKNNKIYTTYSSHIHLSAIVSILRKLKLYKTFFFVNREATMTFDRFKGIQLWFFIFLYRISLKSIDLKIFQSQEMLDSFNKSLKFAHQFNSIVLHNPVDLEGLLLKSNEYFPPYDFKYFIACGRLNYVKGFDILIEAFSKLNVNDYKLLIMGDGPEKSLLKSKISELKMDDKILLIGHKSNPVPFFKNALVCVLSSRIEGFPNVLLEMMSQNGRVISTNCAGGIDRIPSIILAQKKSVQSLTSALKIALNLNDDENQKNRLVFDNYLNDKTIYDYMRNISLNLEKNA